MNVAPYKSSPGTPQFQGTQHIYQGGVSGYGGPVNNDPYYGPQQGKGPGDGLNPTKLMAQGMYNNSMGQPTQMVQPQGTPINHHTQLQALQQQLQQIPGTPQQQPQNMQPIQGFSNMLSQGQPNQQQIQQQQQQIFQQQEQQRQQLQQNLPQMAQPGMLQHASISVDPSIMNSTHWQHQVKLEKVSQASNSPHFYARSAASASRSPLEAANNNDPNGSQQGVTLIEITKATLSSVIVEEELTSGNNEHRRPIHAQSEIDEEEEDQKNRIRENNAQLWTGLDLSGQQLSFVSPRLFNLQFLRRLFLNGNMLTEVPKEILKLKSLRVLDLSSNLLKSVPGEMGMLFNLKYLYLFDNELENLPWEFGNLESLQFLGIEGNLHIDQKIITTLAKKGTRGLIIYLRDDAPHLEPPEARKWIPIGGDGEPEFSNSKSSTNIDLSQGGDSDFTLMSYNTLCQHYATAKMYKYTPSWALNWEYRRKKLTDEILGYKPQVICLQEVETKTYEDYWTPLMEKNGYKGVFHCKGRAKTMGEKNAKKVDGCATFFRTNNFKLVDRKLVDYSGVVMTEDKFKKTEDLFNRFANKDNVALILVLQHITTGSKVLVANTHLHWDPEYNDVKTMQVAVLLDELQKMVRKYSKSRDDLNKVPMVICGDFNSQTNSAVYELMSQGSSKNHDDMDGRDYGKFTSEGFSHPFHLSSAYDCLGELPFTNFTPTFTEVIDYVWYSTQPLTVRGLLGEEDRKYTQKVIGFPTGDCPSDHIPLIARFEIKKQLAAGKKIRVDFGSGGYSRKT